MLVRLVEGHAAPGALLQVPALVLDVVHLGEDGPGVGGDEAGAPDEDDDSLGPAHAGPGVEGEGVADGLVPVTRKTPFTSQSSLPAQLTSLL